MLHVGFKSFHYSKFLAFPLIQLHCVGCWAKQKPNQVLYGPKKVSSTEYDECARDLHESSAQQQNSRDPFPRSPSPQSWWQSWEPSPRSTTTHNLSHNLENSYQENGHNHQFKTFFMQIRVLGSLRQRPARMLV